MTGYIHSFQSLGTLDGPGVRFVVFLQGCNLRCGCCHNPDTWDMQRGKEVTVDEIIDKVIRYREYYKEEGGITVSGGEPLLQAKFVHKLFAKCHAHGINTCLDTSGSLLNDDVRELLKETDRVLLDIKYTEDEQYQKHVGCDLHKVLEFLELLNEQKIPVTLRQVIIPTLNDNEENILKLKTIADKYACVDKVELLPFKKVCQVKYDDMGLDFPFKDIPAAKKEDVLALEELLRK